METLFHLLTSKVSFPIISPGLESLGWGSSEAGGVEALSLLWKAWLKLLRRLDPASFEELRA